ncbi:MAG: glycosyltransferase family 4 protein [Acidiferrobacterales bacterium]|nr:glycosyltransferase family 4 protein [Acidiferrobacterales bacterium]
MSETSIPARPRVMMVITKADIGGAQKHVLQMFQNMRRSYRFLLVSGAPDFLTNAAAELGIEVCIAPRLRRAIRPLTDLRACFQLVELMRKHQPDLVHAHSFKAGVLARLAATYCRIPTVFTAHGWSFTPGAPLFQRIFGLAVESVLCRTGCLVVTISRHDYMLARRWHVGPGKRRYLVLNAADQPASSGNLARNPVRLLTIGRATAVKNQQLLIDTMQALPKEIVLTIVGGGPLLEKLRANVKARHLESRVLLPGEVEDIAPYFEQSGIFVLCSNFEGLPLSILEAMAVGLPVISTDVGGVNEAVEEGQNGFLVPRGDSVALADRLVALINNPARREAMGIASKSLHSQRFTVNRFIDEMQQVYHKALGSDG